jgi:hypothetical protein
LITLSGASAGLSISTASYTLGPGATINLPNVSATSTTALVIGGTSYTVINALGSPGSSTGTDLQGINGNLSGHYALGGNIDASATATWNSNGANPLVYSGLTPIGNSTAVFSGTFDGLGHYISNLYINLYYPNSQDFVGLFGNTSSNAAIRNITLYDSSVAGNNDVGQLVGYNAGTVTNSITQGGGVTDGSNVGGLGRRSLSRSIMWRIRWVQRWCYQQQQCQRCRERGRQCCWWAGWHELGQH